MTTIQIPRGRAPHVLRSARHSPLRTILLACGLGAAMLDVAADVIGGLQYPGYSFASQAISELSAIGAPSKPVTALLAIGYLVLAFAFGVGVLWAGWRRNHALTMTGAMLMAFVAGSAGLALFPMAPRGTGSLAGDAPHLASAGLVVLFALLAMAYGALALGGRFRRYSVGTIATIMVTFLGTVAYIGRMTAHQSTPGLGIVERTNVYAMMLWLAVLSVALLRRRASNEPIATRGALEARIDGFVAPGFEEVRTEFERNFAERGEIGAAVAAYWHGEKVVDLWGGRRTPDGNAPWERDTMTVVMSTTKGMAAMTLAVANARGWLDYDAPVARYWPEFARSGKAAVTVRQLLAHEAGLVLFDEPLTMAKLHDLDELARLLARQTPAWPPGTRHGYHTMSVGLYMQELIRRVDPRHRTLGRFFHEEIAEPLGLDFYIGLPREIPDARLARMKPLSIGRALLALPSTPPVLIRKLLTPHSLLRRSMLLSDVDWNDRRCLEVEVPAGNGVGTARAIARAYSAFAEGGAELGITPETFARITALPDSTHPLDVVIGVPSYFSLGFLRPGPEVFFGSSQRAFGAPGAGGSFAFADPDAHLGYAYVMNKMNFHLVDDPREKALRDAVYRAIARAPRWVRAGEGARRVAVATV